MREKITFKGIQNHKHKNIFNVHTVQYIHMKQSKLYTLVAHKCKRYVPNVQNIQMRR